MWISNKNNWDESHTDLSKYLIEKVRQQVDGEETISNRHKTTNGYVLIHELFMMIGLVKRKVKFKRRLESLLEEAKSAVISTSVVNDFILQKHFPDIITFVKGLTTADLENSKLDKLQYKLRIFRSRLDKNYLSAIETEVKSIDFKSEHFLKFSDNIDKLVDCLVPYLLFVGYSITSISDITSSSISKEKGQKSFIRLLTRFHGESREFKFLFITKKDSPEFNFIKNKLNKELIKQETVTYDSIKEHLKNPDLKVEPDSELVELTLTVVDPHDFLRNIYDTGIKIYVSSKDRLSLNYFTDFFDNVYWRISKTKHLYDKSRIHIDPVNISARVSTLRYTLDKLAPHLGFKFKYDDDLPLIMEVHEAIYFYNLALGSKSIENSLSLLWTALETLIPYRTSEFDIENARHFVCKSLSLGSISRQVVSFIERMILVNNVNQGKLDGLGIYAKYLKYSPKSISTWANWLCNEYEDTDINDPFNKLKDYSNLLCKQYCNLNDQFTGKNGATVESLIKRIETSETLISYQLDRIYLHRNKIVHAGEFINEYSNLWSHLEWYVGKLISYSVMNALVHGNTNQVEIFTKLEADHQHLMNLLNKRKDQKIKDNKDIFTTLFEHTWQSF
jgi:hypothetical protein